MGQALSQFKEQEALRKIRERYHVPERDIETVLSFAREQGEYIIGYVWPEEGFVLTDGELYSVRSIREAA